MDLWIWILLAAAIVTLLIVAVAATLRAIQPKAPEPLGAAAPVPPRARTPRPTAPPAVAASTTGALSPAVVAQIDALIVADQKIRAIKVLREATGSSLREAKTRIDTWVPAGTSAPLVATGAFPPTRPGDAVAGLDPNVRAEIDRLIAADQKIAAIKLLRKATGLGLKDSKDAVEAWG